MTPPSLYVTQHAVERFMERSGCQSAAQAGETLLKMASRALPWRRDKNQWHCSGWILVIDEGGVQTVFRRK